jgi:hypothetical protein
MLRLLAARYRGATKLHRVDRRSPTFHPARRHRAGRDRRSSTVARNMRHPGGWMAGHCQYVRGRRANLVILNLRLDKTNGLDILRKITSRYAVTSASHINRRYRAFAHAAARIGAMRPAESGPVYVRGGGEKQDMGHRASLDPSSAAVCGFPCQIILRRTCRP